MTRPTERTDIAMHAELGNRTRLWFALQLKLCPAQPGASRVKFQVTDTRIMNKYLLNPLALEHPFLLLSRTILDRPPSAV